MTSRSASGERTSLAVGAQSLGFDIGRIAGQAGGAVWLTVGRAVLLATATARREAAAGLGFFPLTVEYREKMAGGGRIPGSFFRREGRATTREILCSRIVDRSIRPFFPAGFACETQALATLHSFDPAADTDVHAITAVSLALLLSDIPWAGPVAGVRVIATDGAVTTFPDPRERAAAALDLVVAVSAAGLVMVEGTAREAPEEHVLAALEAAQAAARPLLNLQAQVRGRSGRPKRDWAASRAVPEAGAIDANQIAADLDPVFAASGKEARRAALAQLVERHAAAQADAREPDRVAGPAGDRDEDGGSRGEAADEERRSAVEAVVRAEIRRRALAGRRLDGRGPSDVRPIWGEVGCLPAAHGSALFTRGETQALASCTLGSSGDEQLIEEPAGVTRDRFLLHYNFPSYSVGEVRPLRGPGRREVGHGHLARRALLPVLPEPDRFPYTLRLEAEITSSNGSSSMATVCGGCLALMDAGVPLRAPVAGIAMGLIREAGESVILSDILGDEDHLGDMDFKVAGTRDGVTAVQLDNKLGSIEPEVLARALEQARSGRLRILDAMAKVLAAPRAEVAAHAPHVERVRIRPPRIRDLIGPGGRHIQAIQQEADVTIDIGDDGAVTIFGRPGARMQTAARRVRHYTGEPDKGKIYRGRVSGVQDFGCFVELFHGIEGLVHISDLGPGRIGHPSEVAAVGDEMLVKVLGTTRDGKLQLSRAQALAADPSEVEG